MTSHFAVKNMHGAVVAVADFPDEARDCARRMAGADGHPVDWTSFGEMVVHGVPSGWKVLRATLKQGPA